MQSVSQSRAHHYCTKPTTSLFRQCWRGELLVHPWRGVEPDSVPSIWYGGGHSWCRDGCYLECNVEGCHGTVHPLRLPPRACCLLSLWWLTPALVLLV